MRIPWALPIKEINSLSLIDTLTTMTVCDGLWQETQGDSCDKVGPRAILSDDLIMTEVEVDIN